MAFEHKDVINMLEGLVPQIKQASSPEKVFVKYARENNLPPAVLQKLVQVYNTAKTVNYLDKAAAEKRGESFEVIDSDKVLEMYETPEETNTKVNITIKEAAYDTYNSLFDEEEIIDLGTSYDAAAKYRFSNEIRKEAAEKIEYEMLEDIQFEYEEKVRKELDKIAMEVKRGQLDFPSFLSDINSVAINEGEEELCKTIQSYVDNENFGKFANVEIKEKSFVYNTNNIDRFHKLMDDYVIYKQAAYSGLNYPGIRGMSDQEYKDYAAKGLASGYGRSGGPKSYKDIDDIVAQVLGFEEQLQSKEKRKNQEQERYQKEQELENLRKQQIQDEQDMQEFDNLFGSENRLRQTTEESGNKMREDFFNSVGGTADSILEGTKTISDQAGRLGGKLGNPVMTALENLYSDKNNDQMAVDNSQLRAKMDMAFNSLMLTDPVLVEADEDSMRDIFDTLVEVAPSIAADPVRLRAVLREASQYDSLSPFTLKSLYDVENVRLKNEDLSSKADKEKYGLRNLNPFRRGKSVNSETR